MTCTNGKCEYDNEWARIVKGKRPKNAIRYAQLWAEIELPNLLRGEKQ